LPRFICFDCSILFHGSSFSPCAKRRVGCDHRINRVNRVAQIVLRAAASVPALALGACLVLADFGRAQDNGPLTDGTPPAAATPGSNQPGVFDTFSRWLEEGAQKFKANMQRAQEQLDKLGSQARETTKEATGAVAGLPNTRIVIAREQCATAPNGAADCQAAATTLCRDKGFTTGKSLDTQTEQKCKSGRFLIEGRAPSSSECPTHIFVTRAMCQ
jgi:hypothetical protein